MKKRIFSIFLSLVFSLGICSCSTEKIQEKNVPTEVPLETPEVDLAGFESFLEVSGLTPADFENILITNYEYKVEDELGCTCKFYVSGYVHDEFVSWVEDLYNKCVEIADENKVFKFTQPESVEYVFEKSDSDDCIYQWSFYYKEQIVTLTFSSSDADFLYEVYISYWAD